MKINKILKHKKSVFLTLTLLVASAFIYGCQCEGGIGNSSKNTDSVEIISTKAESK